MSLSLLFGQRKAAKLGTLQLDATIREVHSYRNQPTQFPVEDGYDINDNIRLEPEEYEVSGFVTNSPISLFQKNNAQILKKTNNEIEVIDLQDTEVVNNVELAVNELLRISGRKINGERVDPEVITIVTGLRVYDNMVITDLTIPRDSATGQSLRFNARFKKIQIVNTETILLPNVSVDIKDQAQSIVDKSNQNTKKPVLTSRIKKVVNKVVKFSGVKVKS